VNDSERLLARLMRSSSIFTTICVVASSILGAFGSWTGAFSLGPLTQVQLVMTYVGAGFVSLFCLLGSLRTALRAEYWAAIAAGASMAGMYLRHPDRFFGIVSVLVVVGGLTATFFARDGGDFRKVIRDLRSPRNAD
jgi:hypothetical protein